VTVTSVGYVLTLRCSDQPGIVRGVAEGIAASNGNIVSSAQFRDAASDEFVMRVEFDSPNTDPAAVRDAIASEVARFDPILTLRERHSRRRVLIMVSKQEHCLRDLLSRWEAGELSVDIPAVVSNHSDCRALVEAHGIPFVLLPVTPETKPEAEDRLLELVRERDIDFVVLARYMQVLSDRVCAELSGRIINIHHSFLPGFKGARPYHQAYDRGVKLIGATAHFVTSDLDEGPIIEQDVERVTHAQDPAQLTAIGRDIERLVLSRAVSLVADDRVFMLGRRTTVFAH
jgi:formyltetrahydrofolate deformylase